MGALQGKYHRANTAAVPHWLDKIVYEEEKDIFYLTITVFLKEKNSTFAIDKQMRWLFMVI